MIKKELNILILFQKKELLKKYSFIYSLNEIYGIGCYRSRRLCVYIGINKNFNISFVKINLNKIILRRIQNKIFKLNWILGNNLKIGRKFIYNLVQKNNMYKGIRLALRLPVRGQRTHTNGSFKSRGWTFL